MRFVIVDDDKAAANALAKKLAAYDETELCGIALNGLDGLRMINETRPDVLFLDIELPDISGIEFLEHVNCLPQYKCRTVMYTAHDRFMLSAFRNKAFDYLMKPIDDTELRNIVRRVCIEMAGAPNSVYNYARREAKPNWRKPLTTPSTTQLRQTRGEAELEEAADDAFDDETTIGDPANGIACRNDGKFIVYTNSVDFRLVDIREIGVLAYNHDLRVWELTLAHQKTPIRLKRNVNSDMLLALNSQLVRVSQKHIINIGYLMEVTNNTCRFYPPFDKVEDVKVGRLFRKKLIDQFCNL